MGISKEAQSQIFQPFHQGDHKGNHSYGGLGLGLSISKAIIDLHGGNLWVSSDGRGKGCEFILELPSASSSQIEPQTLDSKPIERRSACLLLVEDREDALKLMTKRLEREGYKVVPASNVDEALQLAAENQCDLVVSDLGLPDGNGFDLMRELKNRYDWRGIALSGFGMESDIRAAKEAGFEAHLTKPIKINQLLRSISELLKGES